jgi:hypothetical protein
MDEKKTGKIRTVRDLKVYRKAFDRAMEIFFIANISMKRPSKNLMTVTSTYSQCLTQWKIKLTHSVVLLPIEAVFPLPSVFRKPITAGDHYIYGQAVDHN